MSRISTHKHPDVSLLVLLLGILTCIYVASQPIVANASSQTVSTSAPVDPNKGPSELNHHIAGWALIGIGLLQLASLSSLRHNALRYAWPALFVLAGLFLALWSDGEVWPRGNLNWWWLFQHDSEARQHKIYAFLLCAIGIVEYLRISGSLPRFWKKWAFPVIALIGAFLLLIHDHTGGSGAHSPEAQAYLVNPALDATGEARPNPLVPSEAITQDQHRGMHEHSVEAMDSMDSHALASDSMPIDHSHMAMDDLPPDSAVQHKHNEHHMSASMLLVGREHKWFMIVGLAIGLFKFLTDNEFFQKRMLSYMSPSCMVLLGFLLVLYHE